MSYLSKTYSALVRTSFTLHVEFFKEDLSYLNSLGCPSLLPTTLSSENRSPVYFGVFVISCSNRLDGVTSRRKLCHLLKTSTLPVTESWLERLHTITLYTEEPYRKSYSLSFCNLKYEPLFFHRDILIYLRRNVIRLSGG